MKFKPGDIVDVEEGFPGSHLWLILKCENVYIHLPYYKLLNLDTLERLQCYCRYIDKEAIPFFTADTKG